MINHRILKITWSNTWSNILQIQWSWLFGIWSLTSGFEKIWEKVKILYRFNDPLMHGSWLQLSVMHEIEYCGITSFIYGYTNRKIILFSRLYSNMYFLCWRSWLVDMVSSEFYPQCLHCQKPNSIVRLLYAV